MTGAPLNTPHRPSTTDWPPPFRARVLITLVNALNAKWCIRTIFVLGAVRHLARYHRPAQRSLCTVVGRLYAWIIQKPQQIATVIVPAKLVLKPPVVTIRHRTVSQMIAHLSSQPLRLRNIVRRLSPTI